MRIVVLQAVAAKDNSVDNKRAADLMRRNMNLVKQKDTELTFRIPRRGITGLESFFYTYIHHLNDGEAFHAAVQAETDGFDAVIMGCYFDPILRDVRQAVNIPVVGPAESSMLLATMMGAKFGIVTISPMCAGMDPKFVKQFRAAIPMGRFGDPEEVAQLALFLASNASSFITGQYVNIDGGMTSRVP